MYLSVAFPQTYELTSLSFFPKGEELRVRAGGIGGWGWFVALAVVFELYSIDWTFGLLIGGCFEPCSVVFRFPLAWVPEYTFLLWYPLVPLLIARHRQARYVVVGKRGVAFSTGFQWITVDWVHLKAPTEVHWRPRWLTWVRWEWTTAHSSRYLTRSVPLAVSQSKSILLHPNCPIRTIPDSVRIVLGFRENWIQDRG